MGSTGLVVHGQGEPTRTRPRELPPGLPVVFGPGVMGPNLQLKTSAIPEVTQVFEEEGRAADFTVLAICRLARHSGGKARTV